MGIGTSLGAYFENDFSHQAGIEDHTHDEMVVSPDKMDQNKQLEKIDNDELGGIQVSDKTKPGEYIGELGKDDDVSFDRTLPIGRRGDDGKVQYHIDPKDVPLQPGEESFTLPDNPHLWIRKSKESIPMSSNPSLVQDAGLKGTALSDSLIKEFEAFRRMGKPYRDQRDGAIATPEPPPPDNVTMIHPISDVHNINPMNDTENGIIPMLGAPERVSRAAIKYEDKVYEGQHHGDALDQMLNNHATLDFKNMNEGFTTTHGRFVSREEAFDIAKKQDQITSKEAVSLPSNSTMLLTEDMQ